MNTIIDTLAEYIGDCPLLKDGRLNVDYLPESTKSAGVVEFSIATSPADEVVTNYLGGAARCRYPFVVSSVNDYGPDMRQNIANTGFYEALSKWLRDQVRSRNLPVLPEGLQSLNIKALGSGYLFQPDADAAKYQIQCELEYYRRGDY